MIMSTGPIQPAPAKPLRVGYLLRMYPRFSQTFVVNEILEHERQGVEIEILSLRKPTDGQFHEAISRVRARARYVPERIRDAPWSALAMLSRYLCRAPAAFARAARAVWRHRDAAWIDLVHAVHVVQWARKQRLAHVHVHFGTSEATVAMLARLLGGPTYSLTLHAFDIFRDDVDTALLAAKISASAYTITVSEFNRRYLTECVPGVKAERVHVNYNGIDLAWFTDSGRPRTCDTIFSVGRLIEKKGFRHLVEAVDILRRRGIAVRCAIAGDGPDRSRLQALIDDLNLRKAVQLLGSRNQDQVRDSLQRAACFALPCVRAQDGNMDALPTVLLESMACGCPTISTRLSGIPEIIVDGESGLLVEAGDSAALADAIGRVLADRDLATRLSNGGQARAERVFDIRRNVSAMRALWDGLSAALRKEQPGQRESAPARVAMHT